MLCFNFSLANQLLRRGGHLRHRVRDAKGARLDGPDRAAVHLHPPVPLGSSGGQRERSAHAGDPRQRGLRRRRRNRRVGHVNSPCYCY